MYLLVSYRFLIFNKYASKVRLKGRLHAVASFLVSVVRNTRVICIVRNHTILNTKLYRSSAS